MNKLAFEAVLLVVIPTLTFVGGNWALSAISNRQHVLQLLSQAPPADQQLLGRRLTYDVSAVKRYWGVFDDAAFQGEKLFLQLDLIFPLLYAATLFFSLLKVHSALELTIPRAWLLAPVLIALLADWTENIVQLHQMNRFVTKQDLQAGWIRVASIATQLKWGFQISASLILLGLVGVMLYRAFKT